MKMKRVIFALCLALSPVAGYAWADTIAEPPLGEPVMMDEFIVIEPGYSADIPLPPFVWELAQPMNGCSVSPDNLMVCPEPGDLPFKYDEQADARDLIDDVVIVGSIGPREFVIDAQQVLSVEIPPPPFAWELGITVGGCSISPDSQFVCPQSYDLPFELG